VVRPHGRRRRRIRRRTLAPRASLGRPRPTGAGRPGYHYAIGLARNFAPPFPLQRTWTPLLRLLLAKRGEEITPARLKQAQPAAPGATGGDTALVELFPLPAHNTGAWPYASLAAQLPSLVDRDTYARAMMAPRGQRLQRLIASAKPEAVIFYGLSYLPAWETIAAAALPPAELLGRRYHAARVGRTTFLAVPHPVARGTTKEFWEGLGRLLRTG
jgi:hypothetical protein